MQYKTYCSTRWGRHLAHSKRLLLVGAALRQEIDYGHDDLVIARMSQVRRCILPSGSAGFRLESDFRQCASQIEYSKDAHDGRSAEVTSPTMDGVRCAYLFG